MTTKERLHEIIELWDDERADALLAVIEPRNGASNGHHRDGDDRTISPQVDYGNTRPEDDDHPVWDIVGIASSAEPTDMANNKDEYIADAIEHGWRR